MRISIDFFGYQEKWNQYEVLLRELQAYQNGSVKLVLNGRQSTPYEIAHAYTVAEEGSYMRDYIGDDDGKLVELSFDKIRE